MAYTCPWPCVSISTPSENAQPGSTEIVLSQSAPQKSFAAVLTGTKVVDDGPLPIPCIKGDTLSIKICQEEYYRGIEECKNVLRARLSLNKGDKPYTARDLSNKIGKLWMTSAGWKMVPLGKGYYDFHFDSADDLRKIWAAGTVNLQPGLLRLSQWTKDFKYAQRQTHVSLWIRLMELPQEYWRERILREIASAVGTPIDIDGPTRNCTFGHYARILVDIDLSKKIYDEILVERDGYAFKVEVQYERRPLFCNYCLAIGHDVSTCRGLHPEPPTDKIVNGKQIVSDEAAPHKHNRHHKDVGASTSATGSTWIRVPIPVDSTVTTSQRVPISAPPTTTSLASLSLAIPTSINSPTLISTSHSGPIVSSTVASSQTEVPVSLSSNTFSFPLHNVFDIITPGELPHVMPVLEVVPVVEKVVDNAMENTVVVADTAPAAGDEENNQVVFPVSSPTNNISTSFSFALQNVTDEIPPGSLPLPSPVLELVSAIDRDDEHLSGVVQTPQGPIVVVGVPKVAAAPADQSLVPPPQQTSVPVVAAEHVEVQVSPFRSNVEVSLEAVEKSPNGVDNVTHEAIFQDGLVQTNMPEGPMLSVLQQHEVHPSKNIQDGIDLWNRIREYDARSATEDFTPVLTRKQKQNLKLKQVLPQQPPKTRARGDKRSTNQ